MRLGPLKIQVESLLSLQTIGLAFTPTSVRQSDCLCQNPRLYSTKCSIKHARSLLSLAGDTPAHPPALQPSREGGQNTVDFFLLEGGAWHAHERNQKRWTGKQVAREKEAAMCRAFKRDSESATATQHIELFVQKQKTE